MRDGIAANYEARTSMDKTSNRAKWPHVCGTYTTRLIAVA